MRIRSWLMMGIGYLAGTRAGREQFEELKARVNDFAQSPLVSDALGRTRQSLGLTDRSTGPADGDVRLPSDDQVVLDSTDAHRQDVPTAS